MAKPTSRVSRVLMTGPLAPFADAYRGELRRRGYTARSTVNELRQVARLSCWLEARGCRAAELSGERVEGFLVCQRAGGRSVAVVASGAAVLARGVARARGAGGRGAVCAGSPMMCCWRPLSAICSRSGGWRRDSPRLGVRSGVPGRLPQRGLAGLTAAEVTAAVLRESSVVSASTAQNFVSGLRCVPAVLLPRGAGGPRTSRGGAGGEWAPSSPLPRGISRADARALLGSCDRRALGRRDYAIIIVLLRLGLRAARSPG